MNRTVSNQLLAILPLLLFWQAIAWHLDNALLPSPIEVFHAIAHAWQSGELLHHLGVTLRRVAISFGLAMFIGSIIGIAMGTYPKFNRLADPYLVLLLNIPALVLIILLYVWFGLLEATAVAAVVVNKLPNVIVTLREGARTLDPQLQQMAQIYGLGRWQKCRHVILPQLVPYFMLATRSGLSLIWKIVLVIELLGRSDGVGFQLHIAFQLFDVADILAYSLCFITLVLILEWTILQPIEKRLNRWRGGQSYA